MPSLPIAADPADVHVNIERRRAEHAMSRLPDPQAIASELERPQVGTFVTSVIDAHADIDDRLGSEALDGRRADMVDPSSDRTESTGDSSALDSESVWPRRGRTPRSRSFGVPARRSAPPRRPLPARSLHSRTSSEHGSAMTRERRLESMGEVGLATSFVGALAALDRLRVHTFWMTLQDPEPDLHRFYTSRYAEEDRLRMSPHGLLEFARTRELLRRELPQAPARVLDVGGGTGAHASWLADDGHQVHLVDLVPQHVDQAARLMGVSASVGDARSLERPADWADVVLLLGPLYHLVCASDRAVALSEARRVTRPGGLVAVAGISRYAGLLDLAALGLLGDEAERSLRRTIETGVHDPQLGFTTAYFHTPEELAGELEHAGLTDVYVLGVEGPTGPALDVRGLECVEEFLPSAIACARLVERDPALISASAHLLAFGRA